MSEEEMNRRLLAQMSSYMEIRALYLPLAHQFVTKLTSVHDGKMKYSDIHDGFATADEALQSGLKMVLKWNAQRMEAK